MKSILKIGLVAFILIVIIVLVVSFLYNGRLSDNVYLMYGDRMEDNIIVLCSNADFEGCKNGKERIIPNGYDSHIDSITGRYKEYVSKIGKSQDWLIVETKYIPNAIFRYYVLNLKEIEANILEKKQNNKLQSNNFNPLTYKELKKITDSLKIDFELHSIPVSRLSL